MNPLLCPQCSVPLVTMERTPSCLPGQTCAFCRGIFIRSRDLRVYMESAVNAELRGDPVPVKSRRVGIYRACPACTEPMRPVDLCGSPVIIEQCPAHGLWMDAGHLTRMRTWWQSTSTANTRLLDSLNERRRPDPSLVASAAMMAAAPDQSWEWIWHVLRFVLELIIEILGSGF